MQFKPTTLSSAKIFLDPTAKKTAPVKRKMVIAATKLKDACSLEGKL